MNDVDAEHFDMENMTGTQNEIGTPVYNNEYLVQ